MDLDPDDLGLLGDAEGFDVGDAHSRLLQGMPCRSLMRNCETMYWAVASRATAGEKAGKSGGQCLFLYLSL